MSVFVDSASGNDANPGTELQPWRTLSRLSSLVPRPGQAVYLRCGSVWRESLVLSPSQLGTGATVAGYGNCTDNPARILGADDFSGGWTRNGAVWSRALAAGTPAITQLFVGGRRHRLAQWPNHGGLGAEYGKLAGSGTTRTTMTLSSSDLATLAGRSLVGARAYVRSEPWYVERRTVATWNGNTGVIVLDQATDYPMEPGDGFVLAGQAWMLDAPGEFFHDRAAQRLYVIAADAAAQADLNAVSVNGSVREFGLQVRGVAGLKLRQLALSMAGGHGLLLEDTPDAQVSSLVVRDNGDTGLRMLQNSPWATGQTGPTVAASRFEGNVRSDLDANSVTAVTVRDSVFLGVGTQGVVDGSAGAVMVGPGARVLNNRIAGTAYHGVYFNGDDGTLVSGNLVTDYCLRLTDCAAIYTWNGTGASRTATSRVSTVAGNRIGAANANVEGAMGAGRDVVVGIFLDDKASGVVVRDNWLAGMPVGIGVHNSFNNRVERNQVLLSTQAGIGLGMDIVDGSGTDYLRGNVVVDNRLLPARRGSGTYPALPSFASSTAISIQHPLYGQTAVGSSLSFSGNRLSQMHGTGMPVVSVGGPAGTSWLRLSQWRQLVPLDVADEAVHYALVQPTTGAELISNGSFGSNASGWDTIVSSGSTASARWTGGVAGCSGPCITYSAGSALDSLIGSPVTLTAGVPHLVSFTAVFGAAGQLAMPYVFRSSSPWNAMADASGMGSWLALDGVAGDVLDYVALFVPAATGSAHLALKLASAGVPVSFDNVSLRPLLGYSLAAPGDYAAALHAEPDADLTVNCAALGWPAGCAVTTLDGAVLSLPFTQARGTSALYLRADSAWRR